MTKGSVNLQLLTTIYTYGHMRPLGFELCYHNRDFFYFKGSNRFRTKGLEQATLFVRQYWANATFA